MDSRAEALDCLKGVLLGLYLFAHESDSDFNEWSVDMPEDLFATLLDNWREKTGNAQEDTIDSFCKEWCPEWV